MLLFNKPLLIYEMFLFAFRVTISLIDIENDRNSGSSNQIISFVY